MRKHWTLLEFIQVLSKVWNFHGLTIAFMMTPNSASLAQEPFLWTSNHNSTHPHDSPPEYFICTSNSKYPTLNSLHYSPNILLFLPKGISLLVGSLHHPGLIFVITLLLLSWSPSVQRPAFNHVLNPGPSLPPHCPSIIQIFVSSLLYVSPVSRLILSQRSPRLPVD